ncbi:MAG: DUF2959 domain-containing protein [Planctomycetes bacterium]|nr:DUF2959 domain-containing protein [Planctomycetota bacterium]
MKHWILGLLLFVSLGASCRTAYYGVMEKFGVEKRDILIDRVEEGREAQADAKKEFQSALAAFQSVTGFRGGDLEAVYSKLNGHYEDCSERVDEVKGRIDSIETVAEDLFTEWKKELGEMHDPKLRSQSETTLADTRARYAQLLAAMKKAAAKMGPVLTSLHDHVLFLKHNLNAQAIASLSGNLGTIESDVAGLVREMEASIAEADAFLKQMGQG